MQPQSSPGDKQYAKQPDKASLRRKKIYIATIHSMQRSQYYKGPWGIHYSCSKCDRVLPKLKWLLFRVASRSNPSSPWWLASGGRVMLPDGFEVVVIHKKDKAYESEPPRLFWRASLNSVLQLTHCWEPRCLVITALPNDVPDRRRIGIPSRKAALLSQEDTVYTML